MAYMIMAQGNNPGAELGGNNQLEEGVFSGAGLVEELVPTKDVASRWRAQLGQACDVGE